MEPQSTGTGPIPMPQQGPTYRPPGLALRPGATQVIAFTVIALPVIVVLLIIKSLMGQADSSDGFNYGGQSMTATRHFTTMPASAVVARPSVARGVVLRP